MLYQIVASSDKNDIAGGFIKEVRNVLKYKLGQKRHLKYPKGKPFGCFRTDTTTSSVSNISFLGT